MIRTEAYQVCISAKKHLDVIGAGLLDERADVAATGADQLPQLVGVDVEAADARSIGCQGTPRGWGAAIHLPEDVAPRCARGCQRSRQHFYSNSLHLRAADGRALSDRHVYTIFKEMPICFSHCCC